MQIYNSEIHTNEAQRLEEMKRKKKRAKEKSHTQQFGNDSDDDISQELIVSQTNKASKISNLSSTPSSRPKPHSYGDDPIDRVQAFLTEMPSLE